MYKKEDPSSRAPTLPVMSIASDKESQASKKTFKYRVVFLMQEMR
jgi:hypothetical protein